jgi:transcriptional regulator NrdR family protein
MTHFQQNLVVYSIENFNKYTVISREQNKYKVINQNKEYEVFDQTQLTDDKDIIIQKMHINIQQLNNMIQSLTHDAQESQTIID